MTPTRPDWSPFQVIAGRAEPPRSIATRDGVTDRLRAAAFAELQAREAFRWGAARFVEAPPGARADWVRLAADEDRHLGWLLARLAELGGQPAERPVSESLWCSLVACPTAAEFAWFMAGAEQRGRRAGERFAARLAERDPATASIFARIAREEVAHIELAARWFPRGVDVV